MSLAPHPLGIGATTGARRTSFRRAPFTYACGRSRSEVAGFGRDGVRGRTFQKSHFPKSQAAADSRREDKPGPAKPPEELHDCLQTFGVCAAASQPVPVNPSRLGE